MPKQASHRIAPHQHACHLGGPGGEAALCVASVHLSSIGQWILRKPTACVKVRYVQHGVVVLVLPTSTYDLAMHVLLCATYLPCLVRLCGVLLLLLLLLLVLALPDKEHGRVLWIGIHPGILVGQEKSPGLLDPMIPLIPPHYLITRQSRLQTANYLLSIFCTYCRQLFSYSANFSIHFTRLHRLDRRLDLSCCTSRIKFDFLGTTYCVTWSSRHTQVSLNKPSIHLISPYSPPASNGA